RLRIRLRIRRRRVGEGAAAGGAGAGARRTLEYFINGKSQGGTHSNLPNMPLFPAVGGSVTASGSARASTCPVPTDYGAQVDLQRSVLTQAQTSSGLGSGSGSG